MGTTGTPVVITTTAYVTSADAQLYFDRRLNTEIWDDASVLDRQKALNWATDLINGLNFLGEKASTTQANEFPRDDDTVVPQNIKDACAELSFKLLDNVDPETEIEILRHKAASFDSTKTTYTDAIPEHIAVGIPSAIAWRYLRPYLRDFHSVDFDRVS